MFDVSVVYGMLHVPSFIQLQEKQEEQELKIIEEHNFIMYLPLKNYDI